MGKRFVSNNTASPIFVGGLMIPPGDGRDVDEIYLEPEDQQQETLAETDPHAALRELQKKSVKDITAQLPELSDEDLITLEAIEGEDGKSRSTLLAAIAEVQLQRAQAKSGGEPT